MHVLITRPREDAATLAETLRVAGVESTTEPLLEITYLDGPLPDLAPVQGLLITSANGIRAFARASDNRDLLIWAVGDASARMATELGFADVRSASGDVDALAKLVSEQADPAAGALLHVAGTRLAGDLAGRMEDAGFSYRRCVLYEARTSENLSDNVVSMFAGDPRNLPLWAAGLSSGVREVDGRWFTDSPLGEVEVRFTGDVAAGVLDHSVTLPDGATVHNPLRVLSNDTGSEVVFTLYRRDGLTAEDVDVDAELIAADLARLADHVE